MDSAAHVVRRVSAAGTIAAYAGTGAAGYTGDGGPATAAQLNGPQGCAIDGAGNLFVADANNNVIRRIAAGTGVITTVAGNGVGAGIFPTPFAGDGGPATAAGLGHPYGVAVDGSGNLYVSDTTNQRVRKVTVATGIITTIAGTGGTGLNGDGGAATAATLYNPEGLAVDSACNVYVAEEANSVVRKIAAGGTISTFAGSNLYGFAGDGGSATNARLDGPTSVAFDSAGNLYIADAGNNGIRVVRWRDDSDVGGDGVDGLFGRWRDGCQCDVQCAARRGFRHGGEDVYRGHGEWRCAEGKPLRARTGGERVEWRGKDAARTWRGMVCG